MTKKAIFVCSYGGSGSMTLVNTLKDHYFVHHIHDRNPPKKLHGVGGTTRPEWFNSTELPKDIAQHVTVIFIYRHPTIAQLVRWNPSLWFINGVDQSKYMPPEKYADQDEDMMKYHEYFANYATAENYNVFFIKFEKMWDNWELIKEKLKLPPYLELPEKRDDPLIKEEFTTKFDKLNAKAIECWEKMPEAAFV